MAVRGCLQRCERLRDLHKNANYSSASHLHRAALTRHLVYKNTIITVNFFCLLVMVHYRAKYELRERSEGVSQVDELPRSPQQVMSFVAVLDVMVRGAAACR